MRSCLYLQKSYSVPSFLEGEIPQRLQVSPTCFQRNIDSLSYYMLLILWLQSQVLSRDLYWDTSHMFLLRWDIHSVPYLGNRLFSIDCSTLCNIYWVAIPGLSSTKWTNLELPPSKCCREYCSQCCSLMCVPMSVTLVFASVHLSHSHITFFGNIMGGQRLFCLWNIICSHLGAKDSCWDIPHLYTFLWNIYIAFCQIGFERERPSHSVPPASLALWMTSKQ